MCALLDVGIYFWIFNQGLSNKQEVWGQFGDFVGGTLNPIFSFFSFMCLLIALHLQNIQLNLSSEQLEHSRQELELSRKAQEATSSASIQQAKFASISSKLNALQAARSVLLDDIELYKEELETNADSGAFKLQCAYTKRSRIEQEIEDILEDLLKHD
ncbi:hypothetical protein MTYM_01416 [Methylococcales bacterium]|nr:hypothetical protein MTYM_01416 [Methylococcales bacterium]